MPAIHLIERTDNVRKVDKDKNEWESGFWPVSEEVAKTLIGGALYLHRGKQQPSHFGGEILSYRVEQSGPEAPCVVFTLRAGGLQRREDRSQRLEQGPEDLLGCCRACPRLTCTVDLSVLAPSPPSRGPH